MLRRRTEPAVAAYSIFSRAPWKGLDLQRVQIPPGISVAPAGSNRSGGGGNETAGAFDGKGRLGDPASRQAVTRVNAEQAPKRAMWEPTRRRRGGVLSIVVDGDFQAAGFSLIPSMNL